MHDWRARPAGKRESRASGLGTPAPATSSTIPVIDSRYPLNLPNISTEGIGTVKIRMILRIKQTDELTDLNLQIKG